MGCAPRLGAALLALLLLAVPVAASHQPAPSGAWHPPVVSRYGAMAAELVPVHLAVREHAEELRLGMAALGQHAAWPPDLDLIAADVAGVESDLAGIAGAVAAGLGVLDAHPPEPCSADVWAVERAGLLLLGDAIDALRARDYAAVGARIGAGLYLQGAYGDLVASLVAC
jgi:hypothetical protein